MTGLLDFLNSPEGVKVTRGIAGETGQSEHKTREILSMAMPLLLGGMEKNTQDPQGARSLEKALESKHDGSILDNLEGLFAGGVNSAVKNDGAGILGHIFGQRQEKVSSALSSKSGVDVSTISEILKIAAPLVMGFLGKQKSQNSGPGGLGGLLGNMLGGQAGQRQDLITTLLDSDGDGSVLDDVAGMVLGNKGKKTGKKGLFGRIFGQ